VQRTLSNIAIVLALAVLGVAVWAGRQTPPDRYLQDIQERGALRVGVDPSYPPFETVREGKVVGYDAGLSAAIAGALGVRVEFVPLALDTLYDALAAGKVDMLVSALPFIYERQKDVRYSVPYYQAGQVLVVRAGEDRIAGPADLAGKTVAVELGSNADTEMRRLARGTLPTMQVRSIYHSPEEALDALARSEVDAAVTDNESASAYLRDRPGALQVAGSTLTDEPFVIAMPAQATGLAARVNETIERLRASGELSRLMGGP
jgi:ABC-type amino acid transport substrate-binding protein